MKIKIEADIPHHDAKDTIKLIVNAIRQSEVAELMDAWPAGEHLTMDQPGAKVVITKL